MLEAREGGEEVYGRKVVLEGCEIKQGGRDNDDYQVVLPTNVQLLEIGRCLLPTSLSDVWPSLRIAKDLKVCFILECEGIEYLWWVEDCTASLSRLWLRALPNLRVLFKFRPTSIGSFSGLKQLEVGECHNLKHMFTPELVKYRLQNLQFIHVYLCHQIEYIVVADHDQLEEEEEEEEGIHEMNNLILCFPNLVSQS